jgi:hypothetical protein
MQSQAYSQKLPLPKKTTRQLAQVWRVGSCACQPVPLQVLRFATSLLLQKIMHGQANIIGLTLLVFCLRL